MPKVITARRHEDETEKAQEFIRTYTLFPASLLGLIAIVVGVVALETTVSQSEYPPADKGKSGKGPPAGPREQAAQGRTEAQG